MAEKIVKFTGDTTQRELWSGGPVVSTGVSRLLDPTNRAFTAVMWQQGKPPLDAELNLLQQLQNHLRAEWMRKLYPSGIMEAGEITGGLTSPLNAIRLAESWAVVRGWLIRVAGANRNGTDNQNDILFPDAPVSGQREDLAFLEVWFEEVAPTGSPEQDSEDVYKYGGVQSGTVNNDLLDLTIGDETTRRIQLRWRIRTVADVDFVTYPKGIDHGYRVKAWGGTGADTSYTFSRITDDPELYIAGDGSQEAATALRCVDGYVYGIPLYRVWRRNQQPYDPTTNPNGAPAWVDNASVSNRPDGLFHNVIVAQDLTALFATVGLIGAQKLVDAHATRKDNPHQVTAAQVGAAPASHVGSGGAAHATATQTTAGFMSAADKAKLDNLPDPTAGQVAGGISGLQIDAMYADPTAGPSQANVNGIPVISYAPDADQSASFSRLWGGHDDIRIEIGYFMGADNSGNVRLKISYAVNGGVFTDLFETITPGAGTAYRRSTLTSVIPFSALPAGDNMISIKLARLGTDAADTHTGAFQLASLRLL